MPWMYELRGAENRLVEIRCSFSTENAACNAAQRAKRLVDCICYPNLETLTVVVKDGDSVATHLAEMPRSADEGTPEENVKFPWQQLVQLAFREPHLENVPLRINAAECALSERLRDPTPFDLNERLAIGEALLSLHRLLAQVTARFDEEELDTEEGIA